MNLPAVLRRLALMILIAIPLAAEKTPPKPTLTVAPDYPTELMDDPIEGKVVIAMVINAEGRVEQPEVKSSDHEAFSREAIKAVQTWEFEPATLDGEPVPQRVNLPINFKPSKADLLNKVLGRRVYVNFSEPSIPLRELRQRPRPIERRRPNYPPSKVGSGEEMQVRIRFIIGKDGATYNPTPMDEVEQIWALPAIATVAAMKFEPIKHQGELVLVEVEFPVLLTENPRQPGGRGGRGGGRGGGGGGGGGGYLGD